MDRVAVMIDAGYFFAAGSALVSGGQKKNRSLIWLDEAAMISALKQLAKEVANGVSLLRIYWYDGAPARTGPSVEHTRLASCNDVKLRLGFVNSVGQQKGVDSLIVTDLVELARNQAISDVVLMSGDEDVRIGVVLAQSFGVRVHLLGVHPSRGTQSFQLKQEADSCTEWDLKQLKKLITVRDESPTIPTPEPAKPTAEPAKPTKPPPQAPDSASVIAGIAKALLAPLKAPEIDGVAQYMAANKNNIPIEYDGKLLARSRTALGRDLTVDEKRSARTEFRKLVQGS